jgi:hypothetical protein
MSGNFDQNLNQALNNMLGGDMNGGGMLLWVGVLVILLIAVGVYVYYFTEYLGCSSDRVSVNGKCTNICPDGTTFKSLDKNGLVANCTNATGVDVQYAVPTPAPVSTPISSTK